MPIDKGGGGGGVLVRCVGGVEGGGVWEAVKVNVLGSTCTCKLCYQLACAS